MNLLCLLYGHDWYTGPWLEVAVLKGDGSTGGDIERIYSLYACDRCGRTARHVKGRYVTLRGFARLEVS